MKLTSKERALIAINGKEPDRIPIDYWGTKEITEKLINHFNFSNYDQLLEKFNIDFRYIFPEYNGPKLEIYPDGSYKDLWGIIRKKQIVKNGSYDEVIKNPLSDFTSIDDIENYNWPNPNCYGYENIKTQLSKYKNYATIVVGDRTNRTSILHAGIYLRGMEQILLDLYENEELVQKIFEKVTNFYLGVNKRIFEAGKGKIDIFMMGDDFGTQNSLLISPKLWHKLIKPHLIKHIKLAKDYGLKVMLHSCGAIFNLIPDLIELGIDILNPIQVRADGMVPQKLKESFGDKLCFHGSIDIQKTLPLGTKEDIVEEVKDRIKILAPNGKFIICTTHNIQADTPIENVLTLYDAINQYGKY